MQRRAVVRGWSGQYDMSYAEGVSVSYGEGVSVRGLVCMAHYLSDTEEGHDDDELGPGAPLVLL